jgi:hypothetical protein
MLPNKLKRQHLVHHGTAFRLRKWEMMHQIIPLSKKSTFLMHQISAFSKKMAKSGYISHFSGAKAPLLMSQIIIFAQKAHI